MSQSADLLALLSDGRPHEMRAIHRSIGFMRLNSRIAELRGRGYGIVCDKSNREYVYTLISRPLEAPSGTTPHRVDGTDGALSGCGLGVLPTHEAPRVETSVTALSPQPLNFQVPIEPQKPQGEEACQESDILGQTDRAGGHGVTDVRTFVLPGGQLTLRWAA